MGISGSFAIKKPSISSDYWPHSNLLLIKQLSLKIDVGLKPSSYHQCMTIITSFMLFFIVHLFINSVCQGVSYLIDKSIEIGLTDLRAVNLSQRSSFAFMI